jgi:hypothetical protein
MGREYAGVWQKFLYHHKHVVQLTKDNNLLAMHAGERVRYERVSDNPALSFELTFVARESKQLDGTYAKV